MEDFDEGVAHQLNAKRTWEEAADAVRHLANYDLASIQHPAGEREVWFAGVLVDRMQSSA